MKKINLSQMLESFHKLYPNAQTLYYTEDGNVFLQRSPAIDHANKSGQKWFVSNKTDKSAEEAAAKAAEEAAAKAAEEAAAKAAEEAAAKAAEEVEVPAIKKLVTADFETLSYHDALDLAKELELELADKKAATVMAALEAKLESLTQNNE